MVTLIVWVTAVANLAIGLTAGASRVVSLTRLVVGWLCTRSSARVLCCGFEIPLHSLVFLIAWESQGSIHSKRGYSKRKSPREHACIDLLLAHVPLAKANCMSWSQSLGGRGLDTGRDTRRYGHWGPPMHWSPMGFLGGLGCCCDSYRCNERPGLMISEVPPSQLLYSLIQEDE